MFNTVANNIIYQDTIIKPDSLGKNIVVTKLNNIDKLDITDIVNEISKSNPDVLINTIQYSERTNELLFFCDKIISTTSYYKKINDKQYIKVSNSDNQILKNINKQMQMFTGHENDDNYVSVYDFSKLIAAINNVYFKKINEFKYRLQNTLEYSELNVAYVYGITINRQEISFYVDFDIDIIENIKLTFDVKSKTLVEVYTPNGNTFGYEKKIVGVIFDLLDDIIDYLNNPNNIHGLYGYAHIDLYSSMKFYVGNPKENNIVDVIFHDNICKRHDIKLVNFKNVQYESDNMKFINYMKKYGDDIFKKMFIKKEDARILLSHALSLETYDDYVNKFMTKKEKHFLKFWQKRKAL